MTKEQLQKLDAMAKPRSEEAVKKAEERKKQRGYKGLLLKYLCMALPYGVKCQFEDTIRLIDGESAPYYDYALSARYLDLFMNHTNFYIKPYLRPMSSMTEEEKRELYSSCDIISLDFERRTTDMVAIFNSAKVVDYLLANHFDFMELIPMDAAIEVTEENNPYKD